MPVAIVHNSKGGNSSFTNFNEGLGKVLRMGAYDESVIRRLKWMKDVFSVSLKRSIESDLKAVDLKALISQALHMGDEAHNRNMAASSLLFKMLTPSLIRNTPSDKLNEVLEFLINNNHFFLNLSMASCKVILDSAHNIEGSTLVTAMSRNGVQFGIRVSGLGNEWFQAPATIPKGLYFPGFTEADANPDIGDSKTNCNFLRLVLTLF